MAMTCALDERQDYAPGAVSLERFVYKLLPVMMQQDIHIEILPTAGKPGKRLNANELTSIFEGMLESGEYYMEG